MEIDQQDKCGVSRLLKHEFRFKKRVLCLCKDFFFDICYNLCFQVWDKFDKWLRPLSSSVVYTNWSKIIVKKQDKIYFVKAIPEIKISKIFNYIFYVVILLFVIHKLLIILNIKYVL